MKIPSKKDKMLEIPWSLAKLLSAEPEDYKDNVSVAEGMAVARSMLRLLMEVQE